MPSIFLSHSWEDKFFVRELAARLREYGVKVWRAEAELKVGHSLTRQIGSAIDQTDFFGVVLSRNSVTSAWVQMELQIALQKELKKRQVVVLPLLLDPVEVPTFLRDKKYADFTDSDRFEESFRGLLDALGVPAERVQATPAPATARVPTPPEKQTAAGRRLEQFEDIRTVGLDDRRSYNPDPTKKLYNVYLHLSAVPAEEWQRIFEAERRFPRHTMWRHAWIEGQYYRCSLHP